MAKVKVPDVVLKGIMAVRDSGLTNMLDRPVVVQLAAEMGFAEAARWVQTHRKEYAEGVFNGFENQSNECPLRLSDIGGREWPDLSGN